jgi:hypothetical protein
MPTEVVLDPYGESLIQLGRDGAPVRHAGDFHVAVTHDVPDSFYETDHAGLTWREPAPFHTVRFGVLVADAIDGRFVPGLTVSLTAEQGGRTLAAGQCGFLWHPRLHRYVTDMRLLDGDYDLTVRVAVPGFPRDDRGAGRRYLDTVVLRLPRFRVCRVRAAA